jgi:hypothetical protein
MSARKEQNMNNPIHLISLGAGVQSSTMALMAAKGEIVPMPQAAIFADTQAEPASVYKWLDWLENQLPFPVYRVTAGSLTDTALTAKKNKKTGKAYLRNLIPAYTLNPDGSKGLLGRDCTMDHKIIPLTKKARELGKIKRGQDSIGVIQWIGISLDEVSRMKPSRLKWSQHRWPLIELEMSRHDCFRWMEKHGFPKPPRSACVYCPFHSDSEWRRLKNEEPEAFAEAVRFEKALQKLHAEHEGGGKIKSLPFLNKRLVSIDQIDFSEDTRQGHLDFINECEGMCGV